jgi:large conductance mechanosensitive channel
MLRDFKAFILRGNVVELAVGVVIGAAFGTVVSSLVENLLTPLIGLPGKTDFGSLQFTVHHSVFRYGAFLNDLISFLIIAAAVFFLVVRPVTHLLARMKVEVDIATIVRDCPRCLSEIPVKATRCAFCCADVPTG